MQSEMAALQGSIESLKHRSMTLEHRYDTGDLVSSFGCHTIEHVVLTPPAQNNEERLYLQKLHNKISHLVEQCRVKDVALESVSASFLKRMVRLIDLFTYVAKLRYTCSPRRSSKVTGQPRRRPPHQSSRSGTKRKAGRSYWFFKSSDW